jgi:hypothetical protein
MSFASQPSVIYPYRFCHSDRRRKGEASAEGSLSLERRPERSDEGRRPERSEGCLGLRSAEQCRGDLFEQPPIIA